MHSARVWAAAVVVTMSASLSAQQFTVGGRSVQIHGFFQQGYAYSDKNNFLTMRTSDGSFAMTDGGVNISARITDAFRIGAQGYSRNIGELSNGRVELDWAFGDYRLRDWLGIRAGKVKTPLGLFNDTQDMEFLHTWALLPQAMYPLDLRASTIAHIGGDLYGEVSLKKAGSLAYVAYAGKRVDDPRGGYVYSLTDTGLRPTSPVTGRLVGFDTRWTTPVNGLMAGFSWADTPLEINGSYQGRAPYRLNSDPVRVTAIYGEYVKGGFRLNGEWRHKESTLSLSGIPAPDQVLKERAWFFSGAYRIAGWLELGSYYGRFVPNIDAPRDPPGGHIYDHAVTARIDVNRFWNVKVEGHFIDGHGNPYSAHGFYASTNLAGLQPKTNLLVVRSGFSW